MNTIDPTLTPEEEATRKLAAVMFTDIKGFSRKMAENETGAFDLLKKHDALMRVLATKYGGRVIKSIGDSFMVDFTSAVNAVKCGVEAQKKFHSYNSGKSEFDRIEIRIGIHLGDVLIRGDDILGDGVNIASRVESITEPTRICISADVYNQVRNKMPLQTFKIGQLNLKNIPEPVEIHEILIDEIAEFSQPSTKARDLSRQTTVEVSAKHEREELHEARQVEEAKQRASMGQLSEAEREKLIAEYYARAEKYYQLGHIAEAESELKKIDDLDPQFTVSETKRKDEEENESKAQMHLKTARELIAQGKLGEAERETNHVFEYFPLHVGAQQVLLRIEEERYRLEEEARAKRVQVERKEQEETRSREQQKLDDLLATVRQQMEQRDFTQATYTLREVFVLDPNNSAARSLEGELKQRQERRLEEERELAEQESLREQEARAAAQQRRMEEQRTTRTIVEGPKRRPFPVKKVLTGLGVVALAAGLIVLVPMAWRIVFPVTIEVAAMRFSAANDQAASDPLLAALPSLIVQDISRLRHATVRSFTTTGQIDTRATSAQAAGTTLGVRHLLTGSLTKEGDTYDLGLRLIEASSQAVLMNRRFKATTGGIDQLRAEIIHALIQETGLDAEPGIRPLPSGEASAVLAYLDARTLIDREDAASLDSARARMASLADSSADFPAARAVRAEALARLVRLGALSESVMPLALGLVQDAVKDEPTRPEIQRAASVVALISRRYAAAAASAERSLALDPFQPECHRVLAEVRLVSGDATAAASALQEAASMDPQNPRTVFLYGLLAHWGGDNPTASKYYEQAISAGGNGTYITSSYLASAWLRGTRPAALVEYYRARAAAAPDDYRLQYLLGRAFAEQLDSAEVHFADGLRLTKMALDRDPTNTTALLSQALLQARIGKFADAEASLSAVMRNDDLSASSWYRIANVYTLIQKKDDALKALKIAVDRRYDLAEALNPDLGAIFDEPEFRALFVRPLTESQP